MGRGYISIAKIEKLLLKYYSPDKIIFVDIMPAKDYITKDGKEIRFFTSDTNKINLIKECAKQFIGDVHPYVVKVPRNVLADENHKWGKSFYHYQSELYEYLLKAFVLIMSENTMKHFNLKMLYKKYEKIFSHTRKHILYCSSIYSTFSYIIHKIIHNAKLLTQSQKS